MSIKYVLRHDAVSFILPGQVVPSMIRSDNIRFADIVQSIKRNDVDAVLALMDPLKTFIEKNDSRLSSVNGSLYFDNQEVHTSLSQKIVEMIIRGEDPGKFIKFMENLLQNPDPRAILEIYGFIENNTLPITSDGHLLAYKTVRRDFYDHHSGTVLYMPGCEPEMPRDDVCSDPHRTCEAGLHVCSVGYIRDQFFGGDRRSRLVLVKVNPRDIVSVPVDYNNSKVRCCKMQVLAEFNVRSGTELAQIDEAIQRNLDRLINAVKLNENELRAIIGIEGDADQMSGHGDLGDTVEFTHRKSRHSGVLIGHIKPSCSANQAISSRIESFKDYIYETFDLDLDDCAPEVVKKYTSNVSLNERLIVVDVDIESIQKAKSLSKHMEIAINVYLVEIKDVVSIDSSFDGKKAI